jgi:hypothetical protein
MDRRYALIILALVGLGIGALACNAPTPTQSQPLNETIDAPFTSPQETPSLPPTETPPEATSTPTAQAPTETPTPTPTPALTLTERPTPSAPVSTGPLDFPVPGALDHWHKLDNGEQEATIILHITGGAPPYTIYHDQTFVTATWKTTPEIVFQARGCSAIVHAITVKSADGQSVKHDYWIPVPWCD